MKHLLAVGSLLLTLLSGSAQAQSDLDLDGDADRRGARREARSRDTADDVIREIERGVYVKSNIGTTIYLGNRSSLLKPGTTLMLTLGMDVVDKEKVSVAWELSFYQALHNATFLDYSYQAGSGLGPNQLIQGDIHTFGAFAGLEVSGYPVRRFGIGAHAGGGVAFAPLLLDKGDNGTTYARVQRELGVTGMPVHDSPHGAFYVGPTFEYYTKLSHFSFGLDVDFLYIFGIDYGLMATGYLKYTF